MRRLWVLVALGAVIAALLWTARTERASGARAATGEAPDAIVERSPAPPGHADDADAPGEERESRAGDYVVAGRVVDGNGRPVAGASVVLRQGTDDHFWGEDLDGTTAADGTFRFGSVMCGPCELVVDAAGYARVDADVASGDESIEVVLWRAATVEGTVVDRDGKPVEWCYLVVGAFKDQKPSVHPHSMFDVTYWEAELDESGRFRCDRVPPGRLELRAIAAGREGAVGLDVREGDQIRDLRVEVAFPWRSQLRIRALEKDPQDVEIVADQRDSDRSWKDGVATLLFRDPPGTSVSVCVREERFAHQAGRMAHRLLPTVPLTDSAVVDVLLPEPVPVRLETEPPVDRPVAEFDHYVPEPRMPDGTWRLSPECAFDVVVSAEGFLPTHVAGWQPPAGGGVLRVALRRAGVVLGRLLNASGDPVEGATFNIGREGEKTGPDGHFVLAAVPEGEHVLIAILKYRIVAATLVRTEAGGVTDVGTLREPPRRKIRGRVIDETRRGVGGAHVEFVALAGDRPATTGSWDWFTYSRANGAYEIEVPAGAGFLLVGKKGYGKTPASPDRAEELLLPRPAVLHVEAAGPQGSLNTDWTCFVRWPDLLPQAIWETGDYLPCTLEVAPGKVEIISETEPRQTRTLEVARGETAHVTFGR